MSSLERSAKSDRDWSPNDLRAYNITVKAILPSKFFRFGAEPSLDHLDQRILTTPVTVPPDDPSLSDATLRYLHYLHFATPTPESFIDDFARETLSLLGFAERNVILATHFKIPWTISGDTYKDAQPDICLFHSSTLVLLILVKEKIPDQLNVDCQVTAEAIAAFQYNNEVRKEIGLPQLKSMTIPCISISVTQPTFYLVPVTKALSTAVITAQYPVAKTIVKKCISTRTDGNANADMKLPAYRKLALQHFLAFRELARTHWQKILT